MKRIDCNVSLPQDKKLREESKKLGVSISEILRRAIDLYFEKKK